MRALIFLLFALTTGALPDDTTTNLYQFRHPMTLENLWFVILQPGGFPELVTDPKTEFYQPLARRAVPKTIELLYLEFKFYEHLLSLNGTGWQPFVEKTLLRFSEKLISDSRELR